MNRDELVQELRDSGADVLATLLAVPQSALDTGAYENGWTVRQIMAHVASMEFTYRRLPDIARGSGDAQQTKDGERFDMDGYNARQVAKRATATQADLADEFTRGRAALIATVADLDDDLLAKPIRTAGGVTGTLAEAINATAARHVRGHSADFARAAGSEATPGDRVAATLSIAAAEVVALLAGVSNEQWRHRASAEDWSAAGIAGHLIELMPYWSSKLAEAAVTPGVTLGRDINAPERIGAVVDGEAMTPAQATEAISHAAGEAAATLRRVPSGQWWNSVTSPRYGELSLAEMADRLLVHHLQEHLRQMAAAVGAADAAARPG